MTEARPFRVLPRVTEQTEPFWTGGAEGKLRFLRCQECGYFVHPPGPVCPKDLSRELEWEAVSGRATVHTYTVNHQPWYPGLDPPYVVAIVTMEEQDDLRLMTNIVGCPPEAVDVGMAVQVTFEQYDDVWLPFFHPAAGP
jgi:uncharacterized OB-fold protein